MSLHNPFEWAKNPRPSIFAGDAAFIARSNGLTHSQTSSVVSSATVEKVTAKTGRNPGTVHGLRRADRLATLIPSAYSRKTGVR